MQVPCMSEDNVLDDVLSSGVSQDRTPVLGFLWPVFLSAEQS